MKSTLTTLTFLVAAVSIAPRHSFGQYAWVPVYSEPAAVEAYNSAPDQSGYATYVGEELDNFDDKEEYYGTGCETGCKTGGKAGCECPSCRHAGWLSRAFGGIEYLHWYQKGSRLPPIFREGTTGVGLRNPGRLLFGGKSVGSDRMAGVRFIGGLWLDDCQSQALVVRAFASEGASMPFAKTTPTAGFPFYGIPFYNTFPPAQEDGFQVAEPGTGGALSAQASTDVFGFDITYKTALDESCDYRLDLLAGYQFTKIDDDLVVSTASTFPFATNDVFDVNNTFNGGTIGLSGDFKQGPVTLQLMGKLGIGNMRQSVDISGNHIPPGGAALAGPGGFFAQPPNNGQPFNIGLHERDVFAVSPEASVKTIWCLRENFSISIGYTFVYWSRVAMAGDQIDRRGLNSTGSVNSSVVFDGPYVAGGANPGFTFRDTDFYLHTIDIGALLRY